MRTYLFLSVICILTLSFTNKSENNLAKENEKIAREFIEAYNLHDIDKLCTLFADEFIYTEVCSGRYYTTKQSLYNYAKGSISGIPDTKMEIVSVMANEKFAAVEWIWRGTNSVGWEFMGIPATGKHLELPGVSVMEIENHKIKRNSDYWDENTFMKSIGASEE